MKNIPMASLLLLYCNSSKDPDAFLFEFEILCRIYNYYKDAHKLKLFPATLKDASLRWFMSLGENTIYSWDDMKSVFLKKYQDFCKSRDVNDIIRMQQLEDKNIEEYLEHFFYNFQKYREAHLDEKTVRTVFLKGLRDECIETLNLLSVGDVIKIILMKWLNYVALTHKVRLRQARSSVTIPEIMCQEIRNLYLTLSLEWNQETYWKNSKWIS